MSRGLLTWRHGADCAGGCATAWRPTDARGDTLVCPTCGAEVSRVEASQHPVYTPGPLPPPARVPRDLMPTVRPLPRVEVSP